MRLYLALIGFTLVVTIAVCDSMLRIVEEARKRRREVSAEECGCLTDCPREFMFVPDGAGNPESITFLGDTAETARN